MIIFFVPLANPMRGYSLTTGITGTLFAYGVCVVAIQGEIFQNIIGILRSFTDLLFFG
jgi:hypothetical protein